MNLAQNKINDCERESHIWFLLFWGLRMDFHSHCFWNLNGKLLFSSCGYRNDVKQIQLKRPSFWIHIWFEGEVLHNKCKESLLHCLKDIRTVEHQLHLQERPLIMPWSPVVMIINKHTAKWWETNTFHYTKWNWASAFKRSMKWVIAFI